MKPSSQSPFNLDNNDAYQKWRDEKLENAKTNQNLLIINIKKTPPHFYAFPLKKNSNNDNKDIFPINEILEQCNSNNYCLYRLEDQKNLDSKTTKQLIHKLAQSCGISYLDNNICADEDSLTSIYNKNTKSKREYIPYTNKKLSWHTDGYYNSPNKTIFSMLLHCYQDAHNGGESAFMDHEIAYILLRDKNPKWIKALSDDQAMTIPANILNNKIIRAEQAGPVFSLSPQGHLHMRYSARSRNIIWQQDKETQDAIKYLQQLLDLNSPDYYSDYIIRHKFKAGEGIISRNVLHCRNAFHDNDSSINQRLLFRGRFYDELPNDLNIGAHG